jgi:flagellar FliL protein
MRTKEDEVKEEILEEMQTLFKSSFIIRVNFSSATYQ